MKVYKRQSTVVQNEGMPDFGISSGALESTIEIKKVPGGYVVGYLCQDEISENPIENCDGMGAFFHWKDHSNEEMLEYCRLRGFDPETHEDLGTANPDAVEIDKYEHSGVAYSVRGEGMNCRWDTSTAWAMWAPDKCLLDELKELKGKARREKCIVYARQACEELNKWFSGEVYGVVVKTFNKKGVEVNDESCWGYFGVEYAIKELESQIKFAVKAANDKKKK